MELIVSFRSFTKAPEPGSIILVGNAVQVGVQTNETCYCKPLDVQRQIRARGEHAGGHSYRLPVAGRTLNCMAGGRQWLIHVRAEFRVSSFYRTFGIRVIQVFSAVREIQAKN